MSSTNHTTNYNLPQFVGSDKPAWLGDINPAMSAIDTAMHANAVLAQQGIDDASTAQTTAQTAEGHAQDAITSAGTAQETANGAVASLSETNTKLNGFITGMTINDFETCEKTLSGTSTKLRLTFSVLQSVRCNQKRKWSHQDWFVSKNCTNHCFRNRSCRYGIHKGQFCYRKQCRNHCIC